MKRTLVLSFHTSELQSIKKMEFQEDNSRMTKSRLLQDIDLITCACVREAMAMRRNGMTLMETTAIYDPNPDDRENLTVLRSVHSFLIAQLKRLRAQKHIGTAELQSRLEAAKNEYLDLERLCNMNGIDHIVNEEDADAAAAGLTLYKRVEILTGATATLRRHYERAIAIRQAWKSSRTPSGSVVRPDMSYTLPTQAQKEDLKWHGYTWDKKKQGFAKVHPEPTETPAKVVGPDDADKALHNFKLMLERCIRAGVDPANYSEEAVLAQLRKTRRYAEHVSILEFATASLRALLWLKESKETQEELEALEAEQESDPESSDEESDSDSETESGEDGEPIQLQTLTACSAEDEPAAKRVRKE